MHPSRTHNALTLPRPTTRRSKVSLYQEIAPIFGPFLEGACRPYIGSKYRARYVFIPKSVPRSFSIAPRRRSTSGARSAPTLPALVVRSVYRLSSRCARCAVPAPRPLASGVGSAHGPERGARGLSPPVLRRGARPTTPRAGASSTVRSRSEPSSGKPGSDARASEPGLCRSSGIRSAIHGAEQPARNLHQHSLHGSLSRKLGRARRPWRSVGGLVCTPKCSQVRTKSGTPKRGVRSASGRRQAPPCLFSPCAPSSQCGLLKLSACWPAFFCPSFNWASGSLHSPPSGFAWRSRRRNRKESGAPRAASPNTFPEKTKATIETFTVTVFIAAHPPEPRAGPAAVRRSFRQRRPPVAPAPPGTFRTPDPGGRRA